MRFAIIIGCLLMQCAANNLFAQEPVIQQLEKMFTIYKLASFDELMQSYYASQEAFLQHSLTIYGKADSLMSSDERLAIENMRLLLEDIYRSALEKSYEKELANGKINWSVVEDFTIDPGEQRSVKQTTVYYPVFVFGYGGKRHLWKPGKFMITADGLLKCVDSIVTLEESEE